RHHSRSPGCLVLNIWIQPVSVSPKMDIQFKHVSLHCMIPTPTNYSPTYLFTSETDFEPDSQPSTSAAPPAQATNSAATRAPRARGNVITQAVLDSRERMAFIQARLADSLERLAGALEALAS